MSYKEMKKLAKSSSTYKTPRLTLFGNAVNLVATKGRWSWDTGTTRVPRTPNGNNGNNNGNNGNNNGNNDNS